MNRAYISLVAVAMALTACGEEPQVKAQPYEVAQPDGSRSCCWDTQDGVTVCIPGYIGPKLPPKLDIAMVTDGVMVKVVADTSGLKRPGQFISIITIPDQPGMVLQHDESTGGWKWAKSDKWEAAE